MPHRLDVFLLVLGLTLPILPLPTVRAGPVAADGDIVGSAEGRAATAMHGLDQVRLSERGNRWPLGDDRWPVTSVRLVPGDATVLLEPGGPDQRSWAGAETWDIPLIGSLLVAESVLAAAPSSTSDVWGFGEPLAWRTTGPRGSSVGDDPFLSRSLRHDDLGIAGRSAGIDAWRLCFFLVIGGAAAAWVAYTRSTPATGPDQDASGLAFGDRADLESASSQGIWVALDSETLDAFLDAQERSDLEEVAFLLARKRMIRVRNGTRVEVLNPLNTSVRVYIRNGPKRGIEAWVQREFVRRARGYSGTTSRVSTPLLQPFLPRVSRRSGGVCSFFLAGWTQIHAQERWEEPDIIRALRGRNRAGVPETIIGKAGSEVDRG